MQKGCSNQVGNSFRLAREAINGSKLSSTQRRYLQDVAITRTGRPVIRVQGGRSLFLHSLNCNLLTLDSYRSSLGGNKRAWVLRRAAHHFTQAIPQRFSEQRDF